MKTLATKCLTLSMNRTEKFSVTYLKSPTKQQMHGLSSCPILLPYFLY